MSLNLTLLDSLCLAALRRDMVATYMLLDKLNEERDDWGDKQAQAAKVIAERGHATDGYEVYHWPEFQAFCRRAGILWDLRTVKMEFTIAEGEILHVIHTYQGANIPQSVPESKGTQEVSHSEVQIDEEAFLRS